MATVTYEFTNWIGTTNVLAPAPGEFHVWTVPHKFGDAVSVTASPLLTEGETRVLEVEDVQAETDGNGFFITFNVVNTGTEALLAYGIGIGFISM
jgi:hypothetical protein